jgi:rhodanese-related sulfurtransferase
MKLPDAALLLAISLASAPLFGTESPQGPAQAKPPAEAAGFKNVGVKEFEKLLAARQNQVLDVRTPGEFASGHLPGAINLDINGPEFERKIAALDKNKTYLVHCAAGVRSARACQKMSQLKFPHLYNLEGGLKAWEKAGKPVEK